MVCYREVDSPTLLCLNQLALRLTVKRRYEWKSTPRTLWPAVCWTKKGIQVTRVLWLDEIVEGKSQMIGPLILSAKTPFFRKRNLEKNLQFEDRSRQRKMLVCSQTLGGPLPAKRIFSSGQKSALERHWLSRLCRCPSPVKERNLNIKPCQR